MSSNSHHHSLSAMDRLDRGPLAGSTHTSRLSSAEGGWRSWGEAARFWPGEVAGEVVGVMEAVVVGLEGLATGDVGGESAGSAGSKGSCWEALLVGCDASADKLWISSLAGSLGPVWAQSLITVAQRFPV